MKKDLKNIENLEEVKKEKSADRAILIAGAIIAIYSGLKKSDNKKSSFIS